MSFGNLTEDGFDRRANGGIGFGSLPGPSGSFAGPSGLNGSSGSSDPNRSVAAGVFQINTALNTFKRLVSTVGTGKDTPELREKLHKSRQYINQLAKETAEKLTKAFREDEREEDPSSANRRLGMAKLAKDFEYVLKEFQKAQRTAAEKETTFTPLSVQLTDTSRNGRMLGSEVAGESTSLLQDQQRRQQYLSVDSEVAYNDAVIEEREQGIREVQQQIGEVHEIFRDLAVLVKAQGAQIDDLEAHIEGTHGNTIKANEELFKSVKSQRSANDLTCWIMSIVAVALLILFLVLSK